MTAVKINPEQINEEDINIGAEGSDENVQYGVLTPSNLQTTVETEYPPSGANNGCEPVEIKPTGSHAGSSTRIPVINSSSVYQNGYITSGGFEAAVNGVESTETSDNPLSNRRFLSPVSFIRPYQQAVNIQIMLASLDKLDKAKLAKTGFVNLCSAINLQQVPFFALAGEGEYPRVPQNLIFKQIPPETLEVKRKIEKKKAKKAAGWTMSEEMSDHVQLKEISEILDFVGEKNSTDATAPQNVQKKKLKKKLSSKQKSGNKTVVLNGKAEGPSSTSSDSEDNIDSPIQNGGNPVRKEQSKLQPVKSTKPNSTLLTNGYDYLADTSEFNDNSVVNTESDFTEVLHRKKKAPTKSVTNGGALERNNKMSNYHPDRPQIPRNNIRPSPAIQGVVSKDQDVTKPSPSHTKPGNDVDLSINSFPALGPQPPNGDVKLSQHNESTSATDDDKDSVSSQPYATGPSWAKIAAKPNITTPTKANSESTTPRQAKTAESATPRERVTPDFTAYQSDQQFPDLASKIPVTIPSAAEDQSVSNNPEDVSSTSTDAGTANPKNCETIINQEQTKTEDDVMSGSTNSCMSIEFGTVTSSTDPQSNQKVQHILSQSYTEGFGVYSLSNPKKQVPRPTKPSANSPAAVSSKFMRTLSSTKGCSTKGVQFLDRPSGMPSSLASPRDVIDITFGFNSDDGLPSTGASAQNIDSQTNISMSMSYPLPSKSITILPTKDEPLSSIDQTSLAQSSAQYPTNDQFVTGVKAKGNPSRQAGDTTGASVTVAANILHKIMSMEYNHKPIRSADGIKLEVGNCDGFDVLATIKMLKKEWDFVLQQRHRQNGKVRYLAELPRSN